MWRRRFRGPAARDHLGYDRARIRPRPGRILRRILPDRQDLCGRRTRLCRQHDQHQSGDPQMGPVRQSRDACSHRRRQMRQLHPGCAPGGLGRQSKRGFIRRRRHRHPGHLSPVINCRMRSNLPPYCPVCYTHMKSLNDAKTQRTFLKVYAGDFDGDGKSDALIHNGNGIMTYRSNGSQLDVDFSCVNLFPDPGNSRPATSSGPAISTTTERTRSSSSTEATG